MTKSWLREFVHSPLAIIGLSIIIFYIVVALLAPVIAPPVTRDPFDIWRDGYEPYPKPPGTPVKLRRAIDMGYTIHIFGTTSLQYDIYYGCIWGTITAFRVGFLVAFGALAIGLAIGAFAGYFGGIIDEIVMKLTDVILVLGILIAMALVLALPPRWYIGLPLLNFPLLSFALTRLDKAMLGLIIVGFPVYARLVRREIIRIKHERCAKAAQAVGSSKIGASFNPIFPDLIYAILAMLFLGIGPIVLAASTLSFLGIGADRGYADWGQMISFAQNYVDIKMTSWYTFVFPGLFLFHFVLGWILLGVGFSDILTKLREKQSERIDIQKRNHIHTPKLLYLHHSNKT